MRLRQIALVARDLDAVVDDLCAVLGMAVSFRDPAVAAFGLRNAVMPVGDTFLEVVSPVTADASAARFLARRGGDGGYMVMIQTGDLERDRRRVAALGVRVVWDIDLPDMRSSHLHPRDVGGAILSLEAAEPPASWRWAGPDWERARRPELVRGIVGAEVQADKPAARAARWGEILARPARGREIPLDGGVLRFVDARDGRGDGLGGIDVAVADRERILALAAARGVARSADGLVIGGTRIRLVA